MSHVQLANDQYNNALSEFVNIYTEGPSVLMWWPQTRALIPVKSMIISKENARYLEVKYFKPKDNGKIVNDVFKSEQNLNE